MFATANRTQSSMLQVAQQAISAQRTALLPMHAQTLVNDAFARGVQNIDTYDPTIGELVLTNEDGPPNWAGYNFVRGSLTRVKAMLLPESPRRFSKPVSSEIEAEQAAKLAKYVVDDFWYRFKIQKNAAICADTYCKAGISIVSWMFDATKGEVIEIDPATGQEIHAGMAIPRFDTPEKWILDPRARTTEEIEWAARVSFQPTEWAVRHYPEHASMIYGLETQMTDLETINSMATNSTQWQRRAMLPSIAGKGLVCIIEWYERPCELYPKGRHGHLIGSQMTPSAVLREYDELPEWMAGEIPLVIGVQDVSCFSIYGNGTFMTDLIPAQREITKRSHQELLCADAVGNPKFAIPTPGGQPVSHWTNDPFSPFIPFDPNVGPPIPLATPQMGPFVKEGKEFGMMAFSAMAPASPMDKKVAETTTSGIHAAIIDNERKTANATFTDNWVTFWDDVTKMAFKLWMASTKTPQQLRGIGTAGQAVYAMASAFDITHEVEVGMVRDSVMPQSKIAATATWLELLGKGYGNVNTVMRRDVEVRMLNDIGKGDMTTTWEELEAPRENAKRILARLIAGESIVPRVQDDADVVFSVIRAFMQTDQYEGRLMSDPHLELRLTQALDAFGLILQQQAMAAQAQAMAQADAGKPGRKDPAQASAEKNAPGAPQGGPESKGTQGFSRAPNPNRDPGGNPG